MIKKIQLKCDESKVNLGYNAKREVYAKLWLDNLELSAIATKEVRNK
jgi:hypothetical protein